MLVRAVLFDYSGTLFRLEEDDSWFEGMQVDEREVDGHVQAELMRRLTAPTGRSVDMTPEAYRAWVNRDLEPHLHREAYLHVLRKSGLPDHHAEALYDRVIARRPPVSGFAEVLGAFTAGASRPRLYPASLSTSVPRSGDRRRRRRRRVRAVVRSRRGQARRGDL